MSNVFETKLCEKCGNSIEYRREGSTQGWYCTGCDWSVVTTFLPEILRDTTSYSVILKAGDYKNDLHLKLVASLMGVNLLAARKLLQGSTDFVVFKGDASNVAEVRNALKKVELHYAINPSFPW